MKKITVYVTYNPNGKIQVRTTSRTRAACVRDGSTDSNGFRQVPGEMNWRALQACARIYHEAGGKL